MPQPNMTDRSDRDIWRMIERNPSIAYEDEIVAYDILAAEKRTAISSLLTQVETMVQRSGNPAGFDAEAWLSRWLDEPNPAVGNVRPIDLMTTADGQVRVSTLLAQFESGAYT